MESYCIDNIILQHNYSFCIFAKKKAITMKRTDIKLTEEEVILLREFKKSDYRNLSIEMRQIFYLFKPHLLMLDRPFWVYLSTPDYQAF